MKKKIFIYSGIGIIIIAAAVYFLFFNGNSSEIEYRTEKVNRGNILVQVRATGTINPVRTVLVGTQVSGIIEKIYVDFNSIVRMGQPVAQIDSTFLWASVKEAEANYERNRAQLNESQRNLARTKELFKKDLVSQADLDAAQTGYEAAAAQLKQSEGSVERARVNLQYAVIRSPIDGIVISRDVDVGQTVASSFQTPKMFTIAQDLKNMQVEASVDEADIGQVKIDQEVTFTVDAYPQQDFEGKVTQIRLAPINVQNVVTYTVIISVDNEDMKLRPGMTATATILVDKKENVLRVPVLATRFQPPADVLEKLNTQSGAKNNPDTPGKDQITQGDTQRKESGERKEGFVRGDGQRNAKEFSRNKSERKSRTDWVSGKKDQSGFNVHKEFKKNENIKTLRIWILQGGKNLKSIIVKTGLTDSRWVELVDDQLKEGDEVIIGTTGGNSMAANAGQNNPFGPQRMMMGGPGGGGGRR
ncbi:MAG: efflux RND transporter periplasmic adaptor subunit [Ignavibacteriales bacterium]|nr:efflux RND transporter periplasmic adaptor subunit [Ignavibacteriales bacterium]